MGSICSKCLKTKETKAKKHLRMQIKQRAKPQNRIQKIENKGIEIKNHEEESKELKDVLNTTKKVFVDNGIQTEDDKLLSYIENRFKINLTKNNTLEKKAVEKNSFSKKCNSEKTDEEISKIIIIDENRSEKNKGLEQESVFSTITESNNSQKNQGENEKFQLFTKKPNSGKVSSSGKFSLIVPPNRNKIITIPSKLSGKLAEVKLIKGESTNAMIQTPRRPPKSLKFKKQVEDTLL